MIGFPDYIKDPQKLKEKYDGVSANSACAVYPCDICPISDTAGGGSRGSVQWMRTPTSFAPPHPSHPEIIYRFVI